MLNYKGGELITNRQKLMTFYCLLPFILNLRPGLIMLQTSDDSLLAGGDRPKPTIFWAQRRLRNIYRDCAISTEIAQ